MKAIDYNKMAHYTNSLQPNFMGVILRSIMVMFFSCCKLFQVVLGAFDFEEKLYQAKIINTL